MSNSKYLVIHNALIEHGPSDVKKLATLLNLSEKQVMAGLAYLRKYEAVEPAGLPKEWRALAIKPTGRRRGRPPQENSVRARVLHALENGEKTLKELVETVASSNGSVAATLNQMIKQSTVSVSGTRGKYRYSLPQRKVNAA